MSAGEIASTVLGIIGVGLMIRRSLWAFPTGLVQVVIYGWVCYGQQLYSEALLQVMFFAALAHGWWHWTHSGSDRRELPVQTLTPGGAVVWTGGTLIFWLGWSAAMQRFTGAALPYSDGFVLSVSVASQWLQARKHIENWYGWLVANTVAVGVFMVKEVYLFAGLNAIFWLMALWGWHEWRKARPDTGQ
jgi:nicotinamide mononucleotide transporter